MSLSQLFLHNGSTAFCVDKLHLHLNVVVSTSVVNFYYKSEDIESEIINIQL